MLGLKSVRYYFIKSLCGHTTPVESVRFGHEEEMVVAGSMSGALKVWDLEQAKSKNWEQIFCTERGSDVIEILYEITNDSSELLQSFNLTFLFILFKPRLLWCYDINPLTFVQCLHFICVVVMRTLTGHTSSIKSLDFHPYGDYCTSGSLDCNVKVRIQITLLGYLSSCIFHLHD